MKKLYYLFVLLLCSMIASAQLKVKGKIADINQNPIPDVTVLLTKLKDSTLIAYGASNAEGKYELELNPVKDSVSLSFTLEGYTEYKLKFPHLKEHKTIEDITLEEDNILSELVIVTDVPLRVKNDTLEYNASSFKVNVDANVEALLKKLPGIEIDAQKRITAHGKPVSQILVNNKPFFNRDGSVALQNLPANIIKKIQVTDYKTKEEEYTGEKAKSNEASINLVIDEENNKGFFGKLMGGYGTNDRYEASGMVNYFKGDTKLSVLTSSNNINSPGFSMDEIFDSMGGGRSTYYALGGAGGVYSDGNTGITKSDLIGFNYTDKFKKKLDSNISYYFSQSDTQNQYRSRTENLLPNGIFITESKGTEHYDNQKHNFNFELEYKIDDKTNLFIRPSAVNSKIYSQTAQNSTSTDELSDLLNKTTSENFSVSDEIEFENDIHFVRKFNKKGQNLSIGFFNTNNSTKGDNKNVSETLFYKNQQTDDIRNLRENTKSTNNRYNLSLRYTHPLAVNWFLSAYYSLVTKNSNNQAHTLDFDAQTNDYTVTNERLSRNVFENSTRNIPGIGFRYEKQKTSVELDLKMNIDNFSARADYMGQTYRADRKYITPNVSVYFRKMMGYSKMIFARYNYNVSNPLADRILEYERLNNPLNTIVGNALIDQTKYHTFWIGYNRFNFQNDDSFSANLSVNLYNNNVVSSTTYDENRKGTTTYENISGEYNINFNVSYDKSYKWDLHNFKYGVSLYPEYRNSKGFANSVQYDAKNVRLYNKLFVEWSYGDWLTIMPSYVCTYNNTKYHNYQIASADYIVHEGMLQTTTYWKNKWTLGNDFIYRNNTNLNRDFRPNYFLWNTSLSYAFYNKALLAKVKVYDLLNQNIGTSRTVSATYISDSENTVLRRYVMFSLTWKFDKFGNKSNEERKGYYMRSLRI